MIKIYKRIQEKLKTEVQSPQTNYHILQELIISQAFLNLKIFNTQEMHIQNQINFYHRLQQNTIKY